VPDQNNNPTTLSSASLGYHGRLDEMRLSAVVRSADWLGACYDTVTNAESFTRYDAVLLNTLPVWSPIPDQIVPAGATLHLTNIVADAEAPPQILTFSLLSAPQDAVLDAQSGVFTWRPWFAEMNTTQRVTLKVTDDGMPPRSATQSFQILVQPPLLPLLGAMGLSNGLWTVGIGGPGGWTYTVEASTNLQDWITLGVTNPPVLPFDWTDTDAPSSQTRFYRVRLGQ
jgi:hypothetical protein